MLGLELEEVGLGFGLAFKKLCDNNEHQKLV